MRRAVLLSASERGAEGDRLSGQPPTAPSVITGMRDAPGTMRTLTSVVLGLFLWMNVHPAAAAIKQELEDPTPARQAPAGDPDQHARLVESLVDELIGIQATLKSERDLVIQRTRHDAESGKVLTDITIVGTPQAPVVDEHRERIGNLARNLIAEKDDVLAQFARDQAHIKKHKLPDIIQQRHDEAVALFKARQRELEERLAGIEQAKTVVALYDQAEALTGQIKAWSPERPSTFDPNNLPFRTGDDKVREPATTPEGLREVLEGRNDEPLLSFDARQREINATELARIEADEHLYPIERPGIQLASTAATSGLLAAAAPIPPGPEFLAATEDVQITEAIQQKADELNNHPVEIYNWVRNSIEFVPTYGSIQGSQMTLDKKSGNAFDTASLLIALLRASNVPARYVYGTVEVPADKVMNWVGGVEVPAAAGNLMGQGGIPHVGLVQGGQIKAFRMEHVWVEAFVDFYPSRAAKNIAPDAWVPMDASFKQYDYGDGYDLEQGVPLDVDEFLGAAQQGATVNETEGWVQNLNQANVQGQLTQFQQQLEAYIENQNPDATVGDVLGTKTIQTASLPHLAASLPYRLSARGNAYAALPDSLQHKFRFALYGSAYDAALDSPLWTYQTETVKLAGKKVTLAYTPSTDVDRQTIESYLPEPHADGSPIQPEEFPQSLPAYKIRVSPELRIEGETVAGSGNFTLGTDLISRAGFTNMSLRGYDITQDQQTAGQVGALGISLNGIAARQLETLKQRLEDTQAKLQASQFETLTGEHLTGDLLTATIWSYFAAIESFGRIVERQARTVDIPGLSYGYFYANTEVTERWGVVHSIRFPGLLMDVGHVRLIDVAKNNSQQEWVQYNRLKGQHMSAMEHAIPETFFDDPTTGARPQGVSAIRALAVAASQGQRIYTLTQANQSQLSNITQSASVMNAIRAALNAGKEVTVYEAPINYAGFNGAGYIIVDPQTGAGAYLIEGGANGGLLDFVVGAGFGATAYLGAFLSYVSLLSGIAGLGTALPILGLIVGLVVLAIAIAAIIETYMTADEQRFSCFLGGFTAPIALLGGLGASRFARIFGGLLSKLAILISGSGILQCI
jgi:transglutaminase-like putative cysteine protease